MEPVVEAFLANGPRYNLLNSAVLELFDFIRRENIRALIEHFVERFWERLQHIDYVDTFQALKLKHEQVLCASALGNIKSGGITASCKGSAIFLESRQVCGD